MSQEERNTVVGMICNILTTVYVAFRLHTLWAAGALERPDALQAWAQIVLRVIPIAIVLTIVFTIVTRWLAACWIFHLGVAEWIIRHPEKGRQVVDFYQHSSRAWAVAR